MNFFDFFNFNYLFNDYLSRNLDCNDFLYNDLNSCIFLLDNVSMCFNREYFVNLWLNSSLLFDKYFSGYFDQKNAFDLYRG